MRLVRLLDKPLSAVAGIVGIPDSEKITLKEALLVSDDRFTLLQMNHVRTMLVEKFSEVAIANLGSFDKTKTYVIKDIVTPEEFESFDPSEYELNDYVFVYQTPKQYFGEEYVEHPVKPVMDKPEIGYMFTPEEYAAALSKYNEEMKQYEKDMKDHKEQIKQFIDEVASIKEFGWLIRIVNELQYEVIADFSFETTKDSAQFGVLGKLPKEVATKVGEALGDLAEDESIKGLTIAEILTKVLKLEEEEDMVGKILPEEDETSSDDSGELPPVPPTDTP